MRQEKNEKIAKWCGFRFIYRDAYSSFWTIPHELYPGGKSVWVLPDFYGENGMSLLFKYAIPKLLEDFVYPSLYADGNKIWHCNLSLSNHSTIVSTQSKEPQVALADAMLEIIEK